MNRHRCRRDAAGHFGGFSLQIKILIAALVLLCAGCTAKTADTKKAPAAKPPVAASKAKTTRASAPVPATVAARKPAAAATPAPARKPAAPAAKTAAVRKPAPVPALPIRDDEDGDRVPDAVDRCHATLRGLWVDKQGCFISQRRGIGLDLFQDNTAMLTPAARKMLLGLAGSVKFQLDSTVVLSAIASGKGDADFRVKLAQQRLESVRQTLIARGVPKARIRAERNGATRTPPGKLELRLVIG